MLALGEISDSVGVWKIKSKTHKSHAVLKVPIQELRGLIWTFEDPIEVSEGLYKAENCCDSS